MFFREMQFKYSGHTSLPHLQFAFKDQKLNKLRVVDHVCVCVCYRAHSLCRIAAVSADSLLSPPAHIHDNC